jgi:hypothetical protein
MCMCKRCSPLPSRFFPRPRPPFFLLSPPLLFQVPPSFAPLFCYLYLVMRNARGRLASPFAPVNPAARFALVPPCPALRFVSHPLSSFIPVSTSSYLAAVLDSSLFSSRSCFLLSAPRGSSPVPLSAIPFRLPPTQELSSFSSSPSTCMRKKRMENRLGRCLHTPPLRDAHPSPNRRREVRPPPCRAAGAKAAEPLRCLSTPQSS